MRRSAAIYRHLPSPLAETGNDAPARANVAALIAHQDGGQWTIDALGAPHVGERSEKALISSFVDRIAELSPQLVTFNGSSFDLPVLRYRALVHGVAAPGLFSRTYFNRYTEDAVDLCDVLSSFSPQGKVTLHELCRVMGLPGKPDGISGADVDTFYRSGRIREIARPSEYEMKASSARSGTP
jgi:3'-5' exonuclease